MLAALALGWAASRTLTIERVAAAAERARDKPWAFAAVGGASSALAVVKPTALIPVTAGVLFGFWQGLALTLAAVNLGAWLGFGFGRLAGPPAWAERRFGPKLRSTAERVGGQGVWTVTLVRLVGFPPAGLVQLACGMSGLGFRAYAAGTFAGMLPWAILMSYLSDRLWSAAVR